MVEPDSKNCKHQEEIFSVLCFIEITILNDAVGTFLYSFYHTIIS